MGHFLSDWLSGDGDGAWFSLFSSSALLLLSLSSSRDSEKHLIPSSSTKPDSASKETKTPPRHLPFSLRYHHSNNVTYESRVAHRVPFQLGA